MAETWRTIRLLVATAWRVDRWRTLAMVAVPLGNTLGLLSGLWLALLTDAVLHRDVGMIVFVVGALAVGAGLGWQLDLSGSQWQLVLSEKVGYHFEVEIARLTASLPGLTHFERAEYHDRLELLRQQQGLLGGSMTSLTGAFKAVCAAVTVFVLLVVVHPVMLVLAVLALPTVALATTQQRWRSTAEQRSAAPGRLARHLRAMTYDQDAGMEIRVFGLADELQRRSDDAWRAHRGPLETVQRRITLVDVARETVYLVGVIAAVGFVLWQVTRGRAEAGDVVLVIYLSQQVQTAVVWPVQAVTGLGRTLRTAGHFLWLADYAAGVTSGAGRPAPAALTEGIRLEHVSFRYPGSDTWVLRDVSLTIRPGSVLALVGVNGAGKTTLVKLLTRMYEPTEGRILVDGVDLRDIDLDDWRAHVSAAFQDFARFEFTARESVGLGDLPRLHEDGIDDRVRAALAEAGGAEVPQTLPDGLSTQLGARWDGADLSTGQWQKVALARGLLRSDPLVTFFDEPTAALDALTEHAQFERFAAAAREGTARGMITILVTHRFSTVTAADTIMVLADQQIAELGSHEDLLSGTGLYADLFTLQADSYRT